LNESSDLFALFPAMIGADTRVCLTFAADFNVVEVVAVAVGTLCSLLFFIKDRRSSFPLSSAKALTRDPGFEEGFPLIVISCFKNEDKEGRLMIFIIIIVTENKLPPFLKRKNKTKTKKQ
jgi:hypothetical protein